MCGGLGYRGSRVKIETNSALDVRAKTPNSLEMSSPRSSFWPIGPLSAAVIRPFESKVSNKGVGVLGFQFNCAIVPVEMNNACVAAALSAEPVEEKRYVHVGAKVGENFVIADSVVLPTLTSPASSNDEVALFQIRLPFATELLTTDVTFKAFEILTNIHI